MAPAPGPSQQPRHARSLPMYLGAGGIATACHYLCTIALVEVFGATPLAASATGFVVGATAKYFLNYFYAFESEERHSVAVVKFLLSLALLFALNALFFYTLNELLGLHYMVAQVLTTALLIPPGYVVSRRWVFATARP
jgi:putative flippase GtrA